MVCCSAYGVFELPGYARDFDFHAVAGEQIVEMGNSALEMTIDAPGAYRAEVRMQPEHLRGYLGSFTDIAEADLVWIYSNAIYVTHE